MKARFRSMLDSTILVVVIAAGLAVSAAMEFAAVRPALSHGVESLAGRWTTVVAHATQAMPAATASHRIHRRSRAKAQG